MAPTLTHAEIQKRYNASPKGKAVRARYLASAKRRATEAKANARKNARRLFVGKQYAGIVETPTKADAINAHIKERVLAFKQGQQDREETQGAATG